MMRFRLSLLLILSLTAAARAGEIRDWKQYPVVAESAMPKQLFALGDVHGDYDRTVEVLTAAHLIAASPATPQAVQWTGGNAVLVCTGDFIDKYNQAVRVIALFRAMQSSAEHAGGRFIVTLGNHEVAFLASGGDNKKSEEFQTELEADNISAADVVAGRDAMGIGNWMRQLPAAAKVGDWFFCHAGNTQGRTVAQITDQTQKEFAEQGFDAPMLNGVNSMLKANMSPRPWWDWDGNGPELKAAGKKAKKPEIGSTDPGEGRLRQGIEALGCHHLVFGHQPGKIDFLDGAKRPAGQIFTKFDGLFFMIDTGMSRGQASGRGGILQIDAAATPVQVKAIYADGKIETLLP